MKKNYYINKKIQELALKKWSQEGIFPLSNPLKILSIVQSSTVQCTIVNFKKILRLSFVYGQAIT